MRQHHMSLMMLKVNHGLFLSHICQTCFFDFNTSRLRYDLRSSRMNLKVPKARTNYFRNSCASAGVKLWNSLPSSLKKVTSFIQFKAKIRSYILSTQLNFRKHHNFSCIITFSIVCAPFLVQVLDIYLYLYVN